MFRSRAPWLAGAMGITLSCGSSSHEPAAARAPAAASAAATARTASVDYAAQSCARVSSGGPTREGEVRQGSSVALVRRGGALVAYVADSDARRLHVVDLASREVRSVSVEGAPEQVLVLPDARVLVTIADGHHIEVYEPSDDPRAPLAKLCERGVPAGPFGIATSPDDSTLVVTSAWDPSVTVLDARTISVRRSVSVERSPRGVLVDEEGRAFISHITGARLTVVDTGKDSLPREISLKVRGASPRAQVRDLEVVREGAQAYALASVTNVPPRSLEAGKGLGGDAPPPARSKARGRIVVPMVSVDPGDESRPTAIYYGPPPALGVAKHMPIGIVVDPRTERSLSTHVLAHTWDLRSRECNLPRAVVVDHATNRMFVACMGSDEVQLLDATAADPMATIVGRFDVPGGPTGLALDRTSTSLVVWGEHDARLAIVNVSDGSTHDIELPGIASASWRRGRELFHASDDRGVSFDGLACASCHPDGGDDGLTWSTPEGPRQTVMLAGRLAGTAPYGWDRGSVTLHDYVTETVRRLRGAGLSDPDLLSLAEYVEKIPGPPKRAPSKRAAAGRDVFFRAGCGTCHTDATGTDHTQHDVEHQSAGLDTPSLRYLRVTGPYFHDGRYPTLDGLLVHSEMGTTQSVRGEERELLLEFLESL